MATVAPTLDRQVDLALVRRGLRQPTASLQAPHAHLRPTHMSNTGLICGPAGTHMSNTGLVRGPAGTHMSNTGLIRGPAGTHTSSTGEISN